MYKLAGCIPCGRGRSNFVEAVTFSVSSPLRKIGDFIVLIFLSI